MFLAEYRPPWVIYRSCNNNNNVPSNAVPAGNSENLQKPPYFVSTLASCSPVSIFHTLTCPSRHCLRHAKESLLESDILAHVIKLLPDCTSDSTIALSNCLSQNFRFIVRSHRQRNPVHVLRFVDRHDVKICSYPVKTACFFAMFMYFTQVTSPAKGRNV